MILHMAQNDNPAPVPLIVVDDAAPSVIPSTLIFGWKKRMHGIDFYPINPDAVWYTQFAGVWYNTPMEHLTAEHIDRLRGKGFNLVLMSYADAVRSYLPPKAERPRHIDDSV